MDTHAGIAQIILDVIGCKLGGKVPGSIIGRISKETLDPVEVPVSVR
ncbi:MAG: hypothetical protein P8013_00175 [Candidatus Sulfobium sp.]